MRDGLAVRGADGRLRYRTRVEREEIQRGDFPIGRRGYDPAAVDEHLRQVADEMERVRQEVARPARTTLSAGTSEQVRQILEAAERSAAELRGEAGREAEDHVGRVGEAADGMLRRLDEVQRELGKLLDELSASGERLADGSPRCRTRSATSAWSTAEAEPEPEDFGPPRPGRDRSQIPNRNSSPNGARRPPRPPPATRPAPASSRSTWRSAAPAEETAAYLDEHFSLADADALLDDVYVKAGG